ncbi:MAG: relaxase/mobilization nuclease domain-containing protein [Pseudomonadota bacterium]|nr:relaxase/mobilization nuclease domain-containing protein [Pseudomonadota bacterium]
MIGKKIGARKTGSKTANVRRLTDYIRDPSQQGEKLLYSGSRGFLTDEHRSQQAEMVALAEEARRSPNPVTHYVPSWREGEHPTDEQVEHAVDIFLDELGLTDHQTVFGVHQDTDNIHCHLAVNRVHPETGRVIKPNKGFDLEAVHRAIARIEHEQGWQREARGRYRVREDGSLMKEAEEPTVPRISTRARDFERRTRAQSAERRAQNEAAAVIAGAKSWDELHNGLARLGMRYERKGSGGIVYVPLPSGAGEQPVKASKVSRAASLKALEKRLGAYQPAQIAVVHRQPPDPKPIQHHPGVAAARSAHHSARHAQRAILRDQQGAEYRSLMTRQRGEREQLAAVHPPHPIMIASRSVLAAKHAREKAELRDRHRKERQRLAGRFPPLDEWLRHNGLTDDLAQIRGHYRGSILGTEDRDEPAHPRDIRAFLAEVRGSTVDYHRGDHRAVFTDVGRRIEVHDSRDQDGLTAALQLAAQKWPGGITLTGSAEFRERAARQAARLGIRVTDPDLAHVIAEERALPRSVRHNPSMPGAQTEHRSRDLER